MSDTRTFQDHDFLVWEAFPTSGRHGFSDNPVIIFHCITRPDVRSRHLALNGDAADAHRTLVEASPVDLLAMLERATEIN